MNVGALAAGPLVDALTLYYNDKHHEGSDGESIVLIDDDEHDIDGFATQGSSTIAAAASWAMTTNRAIIYCQGLWPTSLLCSLPSQYERSKSMHPVRRLLSRMVKNLLRRRDR
jgi:hypothetical protein